MRHALAYLASLIAGEDIARLVQLGVEYYPDPPFGEKSVDDVPEAEKDLMRAWEADTGQGGKGPAARGRGVYRALVKARWDAAEARGTPAIPLLVTISTRSMVN